MKSRKCLLSVCISLAILSNSNHAISSNDLQHSFKSAEQNERSTYTFLINSEANSGSTSVDKKLQKEVLNKIKILDPQASLISSTHLIANTITVELSSSLLEQVRRIEAISHTFNAQDSISYHASDSTLNKNSITTTIMSDEEPSQLLPYTGDELAGSGAGVAIISTGIDYTLSFFGGSGEYGENEDPEAPPMPGSYLEALANGAVEYEGFPTDVVVGGWDFSSENFGNDANPIDQNLEYESWNGNVYPTGKGTEIASIVHQLAPGAKLHAYKVSNVSANSSGNVFASNATLATITSAFEHMIENNLNPESKEKIDIAVLEASGASAFFDVDGNASLALMQLMIERASASGITVVTHAGNLAEYSIYGDAQAKHRAWLSIEGSPTSAVTVGAVNYADDGETIIVPEWAAMGPVRGSMALKPELVTFTDNQPVAKISNPDTTKAKMGYRSGSLSGAARIAAAAAVIKSKHPGFGPAEIKALLANTANADAILESDSVTQAELYSVGHGIENVTAAINSPLVVWETSSNQPYLQFGFHEVDAGKVVQKNLTVRNISDSAQTYALSHHFSGTKKGYDALTFNLPEMVSVPANSSVIIPVTIAIDNTKLPAWPLVSTEDHIDEILKETELNGYISLTAEEKPTLNLGWMIKARNNTSITKRPNAEQYPIYLGWNADLGKTEYVQLDWAKSIYGEEDDLGNSPYLAYVASFVNNSDTATTYQGYPLILQNKSIPNHLKGTKGHIVKAVGGGVFDEPMCEVSGKKLNIAVSFFNRADFAIANFQDRGASLFTYDLFFEEMVLAEGWDKSFPGANIWDDSQRVNQPFVSINEMGQPVTYSVDYNKEYNYNEPNARYVESNLPTYFANNGKNVVSQVCLEDLFHHELDSVEDFDQNFGFHIITDRHTGRDVNEPIAMFNPVNMGTRTSETSCYFDWFTGAEVCTDTVFDRSVHVGFASAEGEEVEAKSLNFQQTYTAQPGEEVFIASAAAPELFGSVIEEPKGFMVMSLNDDFMQIGYNSFTDGDGSIVAKAASNQTFYVDENVEQGTVVGKIELDTEGFYTVSSTQYQELNLFITNTLIGTPFAVNQETFEIYVVNPDALDYEVNKDFNLKVVVKNGNSVGETEDISIKVNDVNDIAPVINEDVVTEMPAIELSFDEGSSSEFEIDFTGVFSDQENDALTFSVLGDGFKSLTLEGMKVIGEVSEEGTHQVTLTATDGINEVSHNIEVTASVVLAPIPAPVVEEKKSSSGSFGFASLLAGLLFLRRKFN